MSGQMQLDLFAGDEAERLVGVRSPKWCADWLRDVHGCSEAVVPIVERLYREFGCHEAFERSKCLLCLEGRWRIDGWGIGDLDAFGLFDHEAEYHDCWDRSWAARHGYGKADVMRVRTWDYGRKEPVWLA